MWWCCPISARLSRLKKLSTWLVQAPSSLNAKPWSIRSAANRECGTSRWAASSAWTVEPGATRLATRAGGVVLAIHHERQGAPAALAHRDDDPALARLVDR
jgi:hypothetical protein